MAFVASVRQAHLTHVDLTRGEQAWRADDEEVRSGLLSHAPRWDDSRLNTPETTPPSIPTNSATGPTRNWKPCLFGGYLTADAWKYTLLIACDRPGRRGLSATPPREKGGGN